MNENYFVLIEKFRGIFDSILDFYVKRFSNIIGLDFDYWVGDMRKEDKQADRPSQSVDVAQFGDYYYFNLVDIRTVVDNYKYWLKRYGSREAVGQEVRDWHDYVLERMGRNNIYLNLFHWLNGAPRDIYDDDEDGAHELPTDEKEEGANG
mgnify:FL=1